MAATESKAEPKEAGEGVEREPLACKTVALRVSIHCQGCKKKVKKILEAIYGVYKIDIDQKQHKVVVTGNVDGETLIWKLTKAGKHAELWPEKADLGKKKQGKTESQEKHQSDAESSEGIKENDKEDVKVVAQEPSKNVEGTNNNNSNKSNAVRNMDGCAAGKAAVQFQEPKPEVRQTVVLQPAVPVTEKKVSIAVQVPNDNEATGNENKTGGAGGGGASGVKKKKKKATATGKGSNNNNVNEVGSDAKANDGSSNQSNSQGLVHDPAVPVPSSVPFAIPANDSWARQHHIYRQYPPHYYAPPPVPAPAPAHVVHSMSYHTAHPSSSYGAAYYAPAQPYSYAHVVRPGYEVEPPAYTYEAEPYASYGPSQPSDSFELFSDENPNACSLM
ncbi:heavy metal-associated isoprenylated plant protein 35-like [Phaseolus vulgaris]